MRTLIHTSALALMAAAADAGGGSNSPAPAPATPALKLYEVTIDLRNVQDGKSEPHTFVIEAADYKSAWQEARGATRYGTGKDSEFKGKLYTSKDRSEEFSIPAGKYTVNDVSSLQERSRKVPTITVESLMAACEEQKINVPPALKKLMEEMASNPTAAQQPAPAAAQGNAA